MQKIKLFPVLAIFLYAGNADFPFQCDLPIFAQEGNDLGSRLANAFDFVLNQHDRAVVIGTDSPDLPVERIQHAFEKLNEADIVLGPTDDGGYYLLGLSRLLPEIFENISWGTDKVLQQTLQRAGNFKVNLLELTLRCGCH